MKNYGAAIAAILHFSFLILHSLAGNFWPFFPHLDSVPVKAVKFTITRDGLVPSEVLQT
jgi:hypothetical protein